MKDHATAFDGSPVDTAVRCSFGRGWTLVNAATQRSNGKAYRTRAAALAMLGQVLALATEG